MMVRTFYLDKPISFLKLGVKAGKAIQTPVSKVKEVNN